MLVSQNSQRASVDAVFSLTYVTHKIAKSMANLTSWLSACLRKIGPFKDYLSNCGCLSNLNNKPQQKQPGQLSALIYIAA